MNFQKEQTISLRKHYFSYAACPNRNDVCDPKILETLNLSNLNEQHQQFLIIAVKMSLHRHAGVTRDASLSQAQKRVTVHMPPLDPVLRQLNPLHTLICCLFRIHFYISVLYVSTFSMQSLPSRFHANILYAFSYLSNTLHFPPI